MVIKYKNTEVPYFTRAQKFKMFCRETNPENPNEPELIAEHEREIAERTDNGESSEDPYDSEEDEGYDSEMDPDDPHQISLESHLAAVAKALKDRLVSMTF